MAVVYVTESVSLPKEMNEIRVFLVELIKDIKAGKTTAEIATASLPNLMTAISGFDQLSEEAQDEAAYNVYGLLASDMAKAFAGKAA